MLNVKNPLIAPIVSIVIVLFLTGCMLFSVDTLSLAPADEANSNELTLSEEESDRLFADLIMYCRDVAALGGALCSDWAHLLMDNYLDDTQACFAPFTDVFIMSERQNNEVTACLESASIPDPA